MRHLGAMCDRIKAICFRQDGSREDTYLPGRFHSARLIVREEEAPPLDGMEMMTVEIEDVPDSGVASTDGQTVIYASTDEIKLRQVRISRNKWESEMDRGLKWRPVKSIAAIFAEAFGASINSFDAFLPKKRTECYYDGNVWRLLDDIIRMPYRQDGVVWETLWVRPQPACPMNGDLVFLLVVRRSGVKCEAIR
jgi:hypothetical protein